jgi:hypothetical protein
VANSNPVARLIGRITSKVSLEPCEAGRSCLTIIADSQGRICPYSLVGLCRVHKVRAILMEELERLGGGGWDAA